MTQRQHDTRVALRKAIHVHGTEANETRLAAIEFCYAHNIDPHWRTAVWNQTAVPTPENWDTPVNEAVRAVYEWERIVKRFVKDDA